MKRPLPAAALATVLLATAAAPSVADAKQYKGKTSQKFRANVRTGADGVVNRVQIGWRAPCGGGVRYQNDTTFRPVLDVATADAVQDAGTYRERVRGGYRARITTSLAGQRDPATDTWSGTLVVKVLVAKKGKVVDRCELKRATWTSK